MSDPVNSWMPRKFGDHWPIGEREERKLWNIFPRSTRNWAIPVSPSLIEKRQDEFALSISQASPNEEWFEHALILIQRGNFRLLRLPIKSSNKQRQPNCPPLSSFDLFVADRRFVLCRRELSIRTRGGNEGLRAPVKASLTRPARRKSTYYSPRSIKLRFDPPTSSRRLPMGARRPRPVEWFLGNPYNVVRGMPSV